MWIILEMLTFQKCLTFSPVAPVQIHEVNYVFEKKKLVLTVFMYGGHLDSRVHGSLSAHALRKRSGS